MFNDIVVVRGGGDIASGTIQKLYRAGFNLLVLETEKPTAIRRKVCFSEAVYDGQTVIEGIESVLVKDFEGIRMAWGKGYVPIVVDEKAVFIDLIKPDAVVDAMLAKKNLGTNMNMATITVALGPGFEAGKDVDIVIETMRGHNLGRLIFNGKAAENTGIPGEIKGYSKERVVYSPCEGIIKNIKEIGDEVMAEEIIAYVDGFEVKAAIHGILRGIIRNEINVSKGLKIADIDPGFKEKAKCFTISDKARNIGGGALEAILYLKNRQDLLKKQV